MATGLTNDTWEMELEAHQDAEQDQRFRSIPLVSQQQDVNRDAKNMAFMGKDQFMVQDNRMGGKAQGQLQFNEPTNKYQFIEQLPHQIFTKTNSPEPIAKNIRQIKERVAELDLPRMPNVYRRDQTFRALPSKKPKDVVQAVRDVLEQFNWRNGESHSEFRGMKLDWDKDNADWTSGKFVCEFCEDTNVTNAQVNVYTYKTENGEETWLEITNTGGSREAYTSFFTLIHRHLIDPKHKDTCVLKGLVCEDFYPLAAMDDTGDYSDFSDSDDEEMSSEEEQLVSEIIKDRMKMWVDERYYERMLDGINELIGLCPSYYNLIATFWDSTFEKALCARYGKCGDLPLARSMLIFMERMVELNGKNGNSSFIKQINNRTKIFNVVFQNKRNWCFKGRFRNSYIMLDQIYATLTTFDTYGVVKILGGGKPIPKKHYNDLCSKGGNKHATLADKLAKICDVTFDNVPAQLELVGKS